MNGLTLRELKVVGGGMKKIGPPSNSKSFGLGGPNAKLNPQPTNPITPKFLEGFSHVNPNSHPHTHDDHPHTNGGFTIVGPKG